MIPNTANNVALPISPLFSLVSSRSKAPSSTIIIRPIVPKIFRLGKKSTLYSGKNLSTWPRITPATISIKTDGTLVRFAISLKR